MWEGILFIVAFCERYREKEYRETVIICYCWSNLSKIHILAMLIWQRQCRLPRLCYVYTRGMNYYIHVPRYVNRVARNKSHRVTVRVFGLNFSATNLMRLVASCVHCNNPGQVPRLTVIRYSWCLFTYFLHMWWQKNFRVWNRLKL